MIYPIDYRLYKYFTSFWSQQTEHETRPELLSIFLIDFPEYKIRLTHLFDKIDDEKLQYVESAGGREAIQVPSIIPVRINFSPSNLSPW